MNKRFVILGLSVIAMLSVGCAKKPPQEVKPELSEIERLLATSGEKSSRELSKLVALDNAMARDRMSNEEMRQAFLQHKKVPVGLGKKITINKAASTVEEALRFIGTQTDYVIKVFGSQPVPEPVLSLRCNECQIIDLIRDIGYQLDSYNGDIVVIEGNEIRVIYRD